MKPMGLMMMEDGAILFERGTLQFVRPEQGDTVIVLGIRSTHPRSLTTVLHAVHGIREVYTQQLRPMEATEINDEIR